MRHKVNTPASSLVVLLRAAAVTQIAMVAVNLSLVHVLGLHDGLTRWPAAVRELFAVHLRCISLMVLTISVLTLRFDNVWIGRPHRLPPLALRFHGQSAAPSQSLEMR
jgi:hypothetical protein